MGKNTDIQKTAGLEAVDGVPLRAALLQALRSGVAGSTAQTVNVFALMWLRTVMNHQYRRGGTTLAGMKFLYAEGGVSRFYRGLLPALMQSPLSRFGDTAANSGVLALLDSHAVTRQIPVPVKTMLCSGGAAGWRIFLMPIDAWKTAKQVDGAEGLRMLRHSVREQGVSRLWHGATAAMVSTWIGHYPWFVTHNALANKMPTFSNIKHGNILRRAVIGFCSSVVADSCSNSIRVIKTTRQTSKENLTYAEAAQSVIARDGVKGLFGRGLGTRIVANGIQGMVFNVAWKALQEELNRRKRETAKGSSGHPRLTEASGGNIRNGNINPKI